MRVDKMRIMTISGLCLFLDIAPQTWKNYKANKDFLDIVSKVEDIIYNQKLAGAAADLLNSNIIARELGLKDLSERDIGNKNDEPFKTALIAKEMTEEEAANLYKDICQ